MFFVGKLFYELAEHSSHVFADPISLRRGDLIRKIKVEANHERHRLITPKSTIYRSFIPTVFVFLLIFH